MPLTRMSRTIVALSVLACALGFAKIAAAEDDVVPKDDFDKECKIRCYITDDGSEICPCDRGGDIPVVHSPEPASMALFGMGLAGLAARSRKRRNRAA